MDYAINIKDKSEQRRNIKASPFKKEVRHTKPHKHDGYFEIIYLSKGKGQHTIDNQQFSITPPIVFVVHKEQVHFWNIESEPEGFVLIIKKSFVDQSLDKDIALIISKLNNFSCLHPSDCDSIEQLFLLLLREYDGKEIDNSPVIEGLLKALLAKLLQSEDGDVSIKVSKDNIYRRFRDLLSQDKLLTLKVADYASLLNTTPQNLNTICRKENNQSATEILSEFILNQAKRLLKYTNLSVKEISFSLNFKDNSHFTKYFKRHLGLTPNEYRLKNR